MFAQKLRTFKVILLIFYAAANLFFFIRPVHAEEPHPPVLISPNTYVFDDETGQELLNDHGEERIYPASMVKMMTAILAIEHYPDTSHRITLTRDMIGGFIADGASIVGYLINDSPTILDLLYGTLLPSGADCANSLAFAVSGNTEDFVKLMNQKAEELGMYNTHFMNPTGLHDDNQYSTCHDIGLLLSYCLKDPLFTEIIGSREFTGTPVLSHAYGVRFSSAVYYSMSRGVVGKDIEGFIGGKSGYTIPAGRCLASAAQINGMHVICVTAQSPQELGPIKDANTIYSWLRQNYHRENLLNEGDFLASIRCTGSEELKQIDILARDTVNYDLKDDETYEVIQDFTKKISAPAEKGKPLGAVIIHVNDQPIYEYHYLLDHDIQESNRSVLLRFIQENPRILLLYGVFLVLLLVFIPSFILAHLPRRRRRHR
ncbi:MAG: D-alanyl-D-alanine carboxypeptidase [Solobacterium sp.]|nr:D-alanyl-D-alanine carboxypeptidase [Solobacterium sp.]